jgi:hypothetical protein
MTNTIEELDPVVLTRDLPDYRLRRGDIGAVVHRHDVGAFEVEFVTGGGDTVALVTVSDTDVRPMASSEILHARRFHRDS